MSVDTRLKLRKFFKKHKRKIVIILVIWMVIIAVNYYLVNNEIILPETTYEPNEPIMNETGAVPKSMQGPINNLIDEYINYCNNKEYEKAYNLLSTDFKEYVYKDIDSFKTYVDSVFDTKKIYNIQNYSNVNDVYIYRVRILDDIMASGLTGEEELYFHEEKFTIAQEGENLRLSIKGYIGKEKLDYMYEDDYMKINFIEKQSYYSNEKYLVQIRNKTDNIIVLKDGTETEEVFLNLGNQIRTVQNENIIINPSQEIELELEFTRFYDETTPVKGIVFDAIRVLNEYSRDEGTTQANLDEAEKLYSIEIKF